MILLSHARSRLITTIDLEFRIKSRIGARTRAKPNPEAPLTKAANKTAQNARTQDALKISRLCITVGHDRYEE